MDAVPERLAIILVSLLRVQTDVEGLDAVALVEADADEGVDGVDQGDLAEVDRVAFEHHVAAELVLEDGLDADDRDELGVLDVELLVSVGREVGADERGEGVVRRAVVLEEGEGDRAEGVLRRADPVEPGVRRGRT